MYQNKHKIGNYRIHEAGSPFQPHFPTQTISQSSNFRNEKENKKNEQKGKPRKFRTRKWKAEKKEWRKPGLLQQQQKEELPRGTFLRHRDRLGRCRLSGFCWRVRSSSPLSPSFEWTGNEPFSFYGCTRWINLWRQHKGMKWGSRNRNWLCFGIFFYFQVWIQRLNLRRKTDERE